MRPKITIGANTFTFNDGDVEEIISSVTSELDHEPMPMSPPGHAMLFDFNGVGKNITVNGHLTEATETLVNGESITSIDEQRRWLESKINGAQAPLTFESNYTSTYNGSTFQNSKSYKSNITFTERTQEPNRLQFRIVLIVGDV